MTHSDLLTAIMRDLSRGDMRLFRNNVGVAYQGRVTHLDHDRILIQHPRVVHFGLAPGSGDLIGWRAVEITREMVGTKIAVFASLEAKTGTGRPTHEQSAWRQTVIDHGGIADIVRSLEDAQELLLCR